MMAADPDASAFLALAAERLRPEPPNRGTAWPIRAVITVSTTSR